MQNVQGGSRHTGAAPYAGLTPVAWCGKKTELWSAGAGKDPVTRSKDAFLNKITADKERASTPFGSIPIWLFFGLLFVFFCKNGAIPITSLRGPLNKT